MKKNYYILFLANLIWTIAAFIYDLPIISSITFYYWPFIIIVRSDGSHEGKLAKLRELLSRPNFAKVLIFSETKRDVDRLSDHLCDAGFRAESIHGDKRQREREKALRLFSANEVNILVATDVAARGLDIKDITHVINYTVPQTYDDYIHRIGRTGRGSNKGMALTFVS